MVINVLVYKKYLLSREFKKPPISNKISTFIVFNQHSKRKRKYEASSKSSSLLPIVPIFIYSLKLNSILTC